ncbi:SdpI family protein [Curtobacterium sp. VKM Ac-1376]|uniref:SdpI family protein n=1 Tax=Curtobacterium sp. VKM Ac-1376 TaxID=123312 RepID=UPI00188A5B55|nr:SdpI family protein [Curtobacterium sp. VKM Ac-1376]MBF4613082.1 SdpI family protein [Curtobacterium sp. VKM Ac-1376]
MGEAMVFALALEIGAALLVIWLTWRAGNGSLPRNGLAGIRTPTTMSSDAAWRIAHRAALRPTIIAGAATVLWCSVSIGLAPLRNPVSVLVSAVVLVGGALLSVAVAHRAVRRASPEG